MKRLLTIMLVTAGMVAGSASAMAVTYNNPYSDLPEWAEQAFIKGE